MIERTVYQCEHCKRNRKKPRINFNKNDMYKHEYQCWYNPKNKTCFTCIHHDYGNDYNTCTLNIKPEELMCVTKCEHWTRKEEE